MLKELYTISNFPSLLEGEKQSFSNNIARVLKIYGLIFLSSMAVGLVSYFAEFFVTHILHFKSIQKQYSDTFQHMFKKNGVAVSMLFVCLIGPVIEETVFRLPLSFKKIHLSISIALAILMFGNLVPFIKGLNLSLGLAYALTLRFAFSVLVFFVCLKLIPANRSFSRKFKKTIIIISICLFGLLHITNYMPVQWALIWIYPVFVLPQLLMGWALTYIRFKNGFIWGIALHCLINSVSMLLYINRPEPVKTTHPHALHKAPK